MGRMGQVSRALNWSCYFTGTKGLHSSTFRLDVSTFCGLLHWGTLVHYEHTVREGACGPATPPRCPPMPPPSRVAHLYPFHLNLSK